MYMYMYTFVAKAFLYSIFTPRAYALAGLSDCFCLSVCDKIAL